MRRPLLTFFFLVLIQCSLFSQEPINELSEKVLTANGKVVNFQILKPEGWKAEIDNNWGFVEYQNDSEIIHHVAKVDIFKDKLDDFESGGILIEVRNIEKQFLTLNQLANKHINDYEREFGRFKITNLDIGHAKYSSISKLYEALDKGSDFTEYNVFVDPGSKYKYIISISLLSSHGGRLATTDELVMFGKVVNSFKMLK